MERVLIFVSILCIIINTTSTTDDLQPLESSVRTPKNKITNEFKRNTEGRDTEDYEDTYDYVDNKNQHAAPIDEPDKSKPKIMFKNLEVDKTEMKKPEKFASSPEKVDDVGFLRVRKDRKDKSKRSKQASRTKKKDMEIFYRRSIFDGNERHKPQKYTHCLTLLSPFLNGVLSNISYVKKVNATDTTIVRLSYLLGLNMTDASTDEIRAVLHELSSLQLRVFQWNFMTITAIMKVITNSDRHDFRGLKYGIKSLFASWKLDTSNLTRVLTQSRIFRPPCLQITTDGGSTVTQRNENARYTKKSNPKPQCTPGNDDYEECQEAGADINETV